MPLKVHILGIEHFLKHDCSIEITVFRAVRFIYKYIVTVKLVHVVEFYTVQYIHSQIKRIVNDLPHAEKERVI